MNEQMKKRLCWNCEGSVSKQLETCPYCGVYLSPTDQSGNEDRHLLSPPFPQEATKEETRNELKNEKEEAEEETSILASLVLFLSGFTFALFGLALWLFADKGRLTLSWSADWAPLFMLLSLPLLFFGIRSLLKRGE